MLTQAGCGIAPAQPQAGCGTALAQPQQDTTEDPATNFASEPTQIMPSKYQKANKPTVKILDSDVKSHPLFKNLQTQVETCRGINVQLSTKNTRLEETQLTYKFSQLLQHQFNHETKYCIIPNVGSYPARNIVVSTAVLAKNSSILTGKIPFLRLEIHPA